MRKDGYIEITIHGLRGNLKLLPESFEIRDLKDVIDLVGTQNPATGEIDKQSLKFLELIDYVAHYDQQYLKRLRSKAMAWLKRTDPDEWVINMRGYDASRCIA